MKLAFTILGILMILAGAVWIGQGVGLIPGSFMSGDMKWAYIGCGTAVVGIALIWFARRK
jgi:hypothetical protein